MNLKNLDQGQDSFLDIIANLVGVLIILVVIVGAQATSSLIAPAAPEESKVELQTVEVNDAADDLAFEELKTELQSQLSSQALTENKLRVDRARLEMQANDEKKLAQQLATRRHAMLIQLETVREHHENHKKEIASQLDQRQKEQLELQSQKIQLVAQLESLEKTINAVSVSRIESSVETIEHFPNPIAKTVFSNEIHFRLDGGKIIHVPFDGLIELMKGEIGLKAEKLQNTDGTRETVGPLNGFRLQYALAVDTDPQTGRSVGAYKGFTIWPVDSDAGEEIEVALQNGSRFTNILSRLEPRRTTVSVWVYPNSYAEHAKLKEWLYGKGFQMASWPVGEGRHIRGGPNGSRSAAQ